MVCRLHAKQHMLKMFIMSVTNDKNAKKNERSSNPDLLKESSNVLQVFEKYLHGCESEYENKWARRGRKKGKNEEY